MLENMIRSPFQLRGNLFTLSVMQLHSADLNEIERELKMVIQKAPKFFEQAPIVIGLQEFDAQADIDFTKLVALLRQYGTIPVGVRGGRAELQKSARSAGLAILSNTKQEAPSLSSRTTESKESDEAKSKKETTLRRKSVSQAAPSKSLIITKPVRSGQQLYAKDGDLIVIGPVSQGAECLADGSIHIYGPLRGRALAGVSGNTQARIFTQELDAELIAIAGHYMVHEALQNGLQKGAQQISLQDEKLIIDTLK